MKLIYTRTNFSHTYLGETGVYDVALSVPEITSVRSRDTSPNIELWILLKIKLVQDNTGTAGGRKREWGNTNYKFAPWPTADWNNFKTAFEQKANFWDNKFWLVISDAGRRSSPYRQVERSLSIIETVNSEKKLICPMIVSCRFEALLTDINPHFNLNVSYLVDNKGNPVPPQLSSKFILRSNAANIDSGDVYGPDVAHEIGHRLGLPHIGQMTEYAACIGTSSPKKISYDSNASSCYDSSTPQLTANIMGRGFNIDWRDAVPWRAALQEITGIPLINYIVQNNPFTASAFNPEEININTHRWNEFHYSQLK